MTGTFVFGLSGALVGARKRLDLFGVLVLAFAAGNAGGILRDLMLGAVPPPAIRDWRYVAVSLLAGLLTFSWSGIIHKRRHAILLLDAAGLAIFAVGGAQKALTFDLNPLAAIMLGMLTAIGGGMLRDLLVAEVPTVLRSDFYAVAALAGAAAVVAGHELNLPVAISTLVGAILCFGLRIVAIRRGWQLPIPRQQSDNDLEER